MQIVYDPYSVLMSRFSPKTDNFYDLSEFGPEKWYLPKHSELVFALEAQIEQLESGLNNKLVKQRDIESLSVRKV